VKEIWELSISPQVLPFTLLLIPIALYWLLAVVGLIDMDFLDVDLDTDVDVDVDAGPEIDTDVDAGHHTPGAGILHGALRLMGANDIPIMAMMSIIIVLLWTLAMLGNLWFNPDQANLAGRIIGIVALVGAVLLARVITMPLRPFFRAMKKGGTENRPVIGRTGKVRTGKLTAESGQVLVEEKGDQLFLNARLMAGSDPLPRGAEVLIYKYDKETGIYYVRSLNEPSDT
jgi:hypothetical protein